MSTFTTSADSSHLARNSARSQRSHNGLNHSESMISDSQVSHEHSVSSQSWVGSESIVTGETEESEDRPPLSGLINFDDEPDDPSVIGMDSPVDNYRESKASEAKEKGEGESTTGNSFVRSTSTKKTPRTADAMSKTKTPERSGTRNACKAAVYASLVIFGIASVIVFISYSANSSLETTTTNDVEETNEKMMLLAERIIRACSQFDISNEDVECQKLCEMHMCCFDQNNETNCVTDKNMDCAVHAACEVMIEPNENIEEYE